MELEKEISTNLENERYLQEQIGGTSFDSDKDDEKESAIKKIFDEIYNLNVCGEDPLKVHRDISKMNLDAEVMIIAEAMAPEQVRLSGVNYFFKDGTIGNTGKSLEKFLNLFDYSVYPNHQNCVYHTEIVHSFPGYNPNKIKKAIRRPTGKEIELSIQSGILQREIEVIKPKVIILMGKTSYRSFYKYLLEEKPKRSLTGEIELISNSSRYDKYKNTPIIPIQHSSGANPRFYEMLKNEKLVGLIQKILHS